MRRALVLLTVVALHGAAAAQQGPDRPQRDEVVATQLLPRHVKASLRKLAAASDATLTDAERIANARRLIEAGRAQGDPRTLGYAEAMLARWPHDSTDAPLDALVLRATIEQSRHNFAAARALLDRVLSRAPDHGQALLTRATIATVGGDYDAAARDCARLRPLAIDAAAICAAAVDAMTGNDDRALAMLRIAVARSEGALRAWALALQAQVHEQRGDLQAAEASYRAALALDDDLVTRAAYADLLLAQQRAGEAQRLLRDAPPTDALLLRQWRAARATPAAAPLEAQLAAQLEARFGPAAPRDANGTLLHAREAAWFLLERGDAAGALQLARANWATQRESADLLVLAHSAAAAGNTAARHEVKKWLAQSGLRDVRIDAALHGS
jgi:tetratricopeptide (TPR) repeat protein